MDLVQTLVNALVLGAVGAVLTWMIHGLRKEVQALRTEMREDIQALRTELHEEIRSLRSDLTQVALAVGANPRAENA